jgi:dihydrofolate synthase/folylpolyglutamate synthase
LLVEFEVMMSSDHLMERFLALHPKLIDLSLGRLHRLLDALGNPQHRLPPIIHVAGTNGKGSTIAFMRGILEAAGLSVHVYTSPHLVRFHERIRLGSLGGGKLVAEDILVDAFERCEKANAGEPITVFEMTTAAAFVLFSEHKADVLLLEVGLGGEFDATNVIDTALATVVTPVSMDHSEYLGDTLTLIAKAKAGILKRGIPAIIAQQDHPEAEAVLERQAARVGAKLIAAGHHFQSYEENGRFIFQDEDGLLDLPLPKLLGRHQYSNAGTAIAALRAAGLGTLSVSAYEQGIANATWPARLQRLSTGTLAKLIPEDSELWLDGGHNPDGGKVLASAMQDFNRKLLRPLVMIVGMLGTKDSAAFLEAFRGLATEVIAVPIPSQKVSRAPEEVASLAEKAGLNAHISLGFEAALHNIAARQWPTPPRILMTGSLYLAGEILGANGTPPE